MGFNKTMKLNDLIKKYNIPGPRYTSYPPVPFWRQTPNESEWIENVKSKYKEEQGLDLYVHIPFCESLCYYCGCSRVITKNHSLEESYVKTLLAEWFLYEKKLGFKPRVSSLHFGGGTPTFLSPENLDRLINKLTTNRTDNFIGSIEVDPRTCTVSHIKVLAKHSIRRVSLGVQDFDKDVQTAIHRDQSPEMVETLVNQLREHGIESINFDLIYGLPKQTNSSINETIKIVSGIRPDLIAFYSYAHLPERIKNQRLIHEADLPSPVAKRDLYETGKRLLAEEGYSDVGMDHFALPASYLYQAKVQQNLHRNFMGYVDKKSSVLIGLGTTSISDSSMSFIQNAKDVTTYQKLINEGKLAIQKGHVHHKRDLLVQQVIQDLMCSNAVTFHGLDQIPFWSQIELELKEFQTDGILQQSDDKIQLTEIGKAFARNVAMSFDFYLREQESSQKFSQTI
jgi:oxygen-independent coproporphyrinogen-3 oxidase